MPNNKVVGISNQVTVIQEFTQIARNVFKETYLIDCKRDLQCKRAFYAIAAIFLALIFTTPRRPRRRGWPK